MRRTIFILALAVIGLAQQPAPQNVATPGDDTGWPRELKGDGFTLSVYQPQLGSWDGVALSGKCAVSVKNTTTEATTYGAVEFTASTYVDKTARRVTLDDFKLTKVDFPGSGGKEATYRALVETQLPTVSKVILLDRLEAEKAILDEEASVKGLAVKNDPPQIIVSQQPAVLILIDGEPVFRDVEGAKLERVINTRAMILRDGKTFYMHLWDGWVKSNDIHKDWKIDKHPPKKVSETFKKLVSNGQADALQQGNDPNRTLKSGKLPEMHIATAPTEMVVIQGGPIFKPVEGTQLTYVENTTSDLFLYAADAKYYVLLSGRWFHNSTLTGIWAYVPGKDLPEDFRKIPPTHPMGSVLASVPGTPQAEEAVIANSIPQTASVKRAEAHISPTIDGAAQLKPIDGTNLHFVANSATAIIQTSGSEFYAVENAVWFRSTSANGPWEVATSVPPEIYSIPPSSPLHYVTYVKIYKSSPDVVVVGYTPGYYGTVVNTESVVVYGTGWYYPPYVGTYWYGYPYTYGFGVSFGWNSMTGWSFGIGYGMGYPFYYPWWGPWYGPCCWGYGPWGGWGVAQTNIYGRWGNTAFAHSNTAWYNSWTGNVGAGSRGVSYNSATGRLAGGGRFSNTNIYTGVTTTGARGGVANTHTGNWAVGQGGTVTGPGGNTVFAGEIAGGNTNTGQRDSARIAGGENNVFVGHDGQVYRYDRNSGQWSQHSPDGWQNVDRGNAQVQNLDRQRLGRDGGGQRADSFQRQMPRTQPSWSGPPAGRNYEPRSLPRGGYRGGTSGFRGGGFRRR